MTVQKQSFNALYANGNLIMTGTARDILRRHRYYRKHHSGVVLKIKQIRKWQVA